MGCRSVLLPFALLIASCAERTGGDAPPATPEPTAAAATSEPRHLLIIVALWVKNADGSALVFQGSETCGRAFSSCPCWH